MAQIAPNVSAIAVIDLARELKRYTIIDMVDIRTMHQSLADYVEALEKGVDISEVLELRYPESLLIALWELANKNTLYKDIGLRIGSMVSPEAQGLMSNLLLHCETMGDVLDTYLSKIDLVNASETWVVLRNNQQIEMEFSFPINRGYPRCAVERSMVSVHQLSQYYCQRSIPLVRVDFTFPEPEYGAQLEKQFACEIHYNSHRNALILDEEVLSYTLPQRNQFIKGILEQKVSDLNLAGKPRAIETKVCELLRKDMIYFCHVDNLAKALHMSRTTLYRKLKNENTSFSQLLDRERQRLFKAHAHEPVAKICDLLGFQDPSAYYKACKRWM